MKTYTTSTISRIHGIIKQGYGYSCHLIAIIIMIFFFFMSTH